MGAFTSHTIRRGYPGKTAPVFLLRFVHLPALRDLGLAKWAISPKSLRNLPLCFPNLQSLCLDNIALYNPKQKVPDLCLWVRLALMIGHHYNGRCQIDFGAQPFMELEGHLPEDSSYWKSNKTFRVRDIVLKSPALDVLTRLSACASPTSEVTSNISKYHEDCAIEYASLTAHHKPDVTTGHPKRVGYLYSGPTAITTIETEGATFNYYPMYDALAQGR